jgi:hypothetical protein
MKKALFLCVFCLVALWLAAQSPKWQWAKQVSGSSQCYIYNIATDSSGNSYVTGSFYETIIFGTNILTSRGETDICIAKLDSNGNFLWAKQAGGYDWDYGFGITTDSDGNTYVTGCFQGSAIFGNITLTGNWHNEMFISKLDTNGNWLWVRQAGGTSLDNGHITGISTDSSGDSYVTGFFYGTATFGSIILTSSGYNVIFVAKLDTNGNWLWAKQAGGTSVSYFVYGYDIVTDSSGNSYVTGEFYGSATFGTTILTSIEGSEVFIAKLDTNGNWLWAKQSCGTGNAVGYGIDTDSNGNSYMTGVFRGSITIDLVTLTSSGGTDIFIAKFDANGNWLWAKKAGGASNDMDYNIATDSNGNSCVTGSFYDTINFGTTTLTSSGETDIFVASLDANANWLWAKKVGGGSYDEGIGIAIDSGENCYVTGCYSENISLDSINLTNDGWGRRVFIAKLGGSTFVSDEYGVPQPSFSLGQNRPNPFTNSTSFYLDVKDAKSVYEVSVYDLRGRHICTLHRGVLPEGMQTFTWNGKDATDNELSSGVYFYRVSNGISSQVKKMIYVR